ncbi:MAG: hypothetical protein AB7P03_00280 [Kofleriaceae bacterium]
MSRRAGHDHDQWIELLEILRRVELPFAEAEYDATVLTASHDLV